MSGSSYSHWIVLALAVAAMAWPNTSRSGDLALTGTSWRVVAVAGGQAHPAATIAFAADRVSGMAGCNRFTGRLSVEPGRVSIGPVMSTRMLCRDAMPAEQALLAALPTVHSVERAGEQVVLRDSQGGAAVVLAR